MIIAETGNSVNKENKGDRDAYDEEHKENTQQTIFEVLENEAPGTQGNKYNFEAHENIANNATQSEEAMHAHDSSPIAVV